MKYTLLIPERVCNGPGTLLDVARVLPDCCLDVARPTVPQLYPIRTPSIPKGTDGVQLEYSWGTDGVRMPGQHPGHNWATVRQHPLQYTDRSQTVTRFDNLFIPPGRPSMPTKTFCKAYVWLV